MSGSMQGSVGAAPIHPEERIGLDEGIEALSDNSDVNPYANLEHDNSMNIPLN